MTCCLESMLIEDSRKKKKERKKKGAVPLNSESELGSGRPAVKVQPLEERRATGSPSSVFARGRPCQPTRQAPGSMAAPLQALLLALALGLAQPAAAPRKLLVFLLDGFRSDYISDEALESLPGLKEIVSRGVKVDYLTPDFPTLSYPNYYTLMTGRHTEVHQMIGNYMWDSNTNKSFDIGVNKDSLMPLWWNGSEPLWVTLTKAKRKVHMYYWPGCEVEILGVRPTYCLEYKTSPTDINFANAVSNALDSLKSGRADLAAVYHERIDVEGHHYGPSSPQRKDALKAVDNVFKYMAQWIQERDLQDKLNVIIFSDHGMTDIFWEDKVIELKQHISLGDLQQVKDRGPLVSVWPAPGKHAEVYNKLRTVEHMTVYEKEAIPSRFHYKKGKFVSPLTLLADEGWFITESREQLPFWMNSTGRREGWQRGWHGYDNELMDMRGIFLAFGPDFKSNFRAAPIRSVDVYNLMCHAAGIAPLPNNGSWSRVMCMLKGSASSAPRPLPAGLALALTLLLLLQ